LNQKDKLQQSQQYFF